MAEDQKLNDGLSAADRIRMKKIRNNTLVRDKSKEESNEEEKINNIRDNTNILSK